MGKAPSLILAFIPTTLSRAPTSSAFSILGQAQSLCEQVPPRLCPLHCFPNLWNPVQVNADQVMPSPALAPVSPLTVAG